MSTRDDPLAGPVTPDRVFYATGAMLGAEDFTAEQVYHRFQLSRALAYLHGHGTVAGLRVTHEPATATRPERINVLPGLAVDRLGRLVEVPRRWCIRLDDWFDAQTADGLEAGFKQGVTVAVPDDSADPPADAPLTLDGVVADVFLRFTTCPRGLTPAFPTGPFDALDAVAPSRIRDGFAVDLVLRDDPNPQVPAPPPTDVAALGEFTPRLRAARKTQLDGWREATDRRPGGLLAPEREHQARQDPAALFLARVIIPSDPGPPVTRLGAPVVVDNYSRRFVSGAPVLARFIGI